MYTIDWKSTGITFEIDGIVVRTYLNNAQAVSPMTPAGERWFPSTPSQVQISVWDGCAGGPGGTCNWADGPIQWGSATSFTAAFASIDVQCYDSSNLPVSKWPAGPSNPDRLDADPSQPTTASGPLPNGGSVVNTGGQQASTTNARQSGAVGAAVGLVSFLGALVLAM